jgi:predicted transcriptional regulator
LSHPCTICALPPETVTAAERRRASGDSTAGIARDLGVSEDALRRHLKNHTSKKVLKSLAQEKDRKDAKAGDDLRGVPRALMAKAVSFMNQAEAAGDLRAANIAIRSALAAMQELAKMEGWYPNGHGQNVQTNVQVQLAQVKVESPEELVRRLHAVVREQVEHDISQRA